MLLFEVNWLFSPCHVDYGLYKLYPADTWKYQLETQISILSKCAVVHADGYTTKVKHKATIYLDVNGNY